MTTDGADLTSAAESFAGEITTTLAAVLGPSTSTFVAEASPVPGAKQRVAIHTADGDPITLTIDDVPCLWLVVEFECSWDHQGTFLAVQKSTFKVLPEGRAAPLFRYEFVNDMSPHLPSAHLHIHAHRDEFLFALFRGGHGKPAVRAKAVDGSSARARPQLSDVHFPLGGPRLRPCLEDLLQMLRAEFGVDMEDGFQDALNSGRARWRRRQIAAAVRDAPAEAVRVLEQLGFTVVGPNPGAASERIDKLTKM